MDRSFDTRIDRDVRPLFIVNNSTFGGIVDRHPRVTQYWTGDNVGDLFVGAKINLLSEYRQNPAAFAVRGLVKLPTAKKDVGNGTGKADVAVDAIISKEAVALVEVSGFGGYEWRGSPDDFDVPTGALRWGAGLAFPSRNVVRLNAELNGFVPSSDTATSRACRCGGGQQFAPLVSETGKITRATLGITAQAPNGFFGSVGVSWNVPARAARRRLRSSARIRSGTRRRRHRPSRPTTAVAGEPAADGAGAVRSVHGGNRAELDGDGDGAGSG